MSRFLSPLLFLLVLLAAGCSTVSSRIKERPEVFGRLSPADQQLVTNGEVREGMTRDAVYLAWGRPDDLVRGSEDGSAYEEWVYTANSTELVSSYYPVYAHYGRRCSGWDYPFMPMVVSRPYPYKSVRFVQGKAIAWRIAPIR